MKFTFPFQRSLLLILLFTSPPATAENADDPTGPSANLPTGWVSPAASAAQEFEREVYALIPLEEPPDDGLTHQYQVSCVTDAGEVDFWHFWSADPSSYDWEGERLLWWQGDIDATTFYPVEGREYRAMNRAGQYTYWERLPDPVGGGLPGPPDGVIASLKGVFVATDGSESEIGFLKYHDIIDSQALEWEQILLTEWGWSSVAISPQTDAIVNSCHSFFVQEDGTAFGSPAESREYSRTRIRLSNGTSVDDRVRNYAVTAWHHWDFGGTAPSLFEGAPTSKEFDYLHQYAGILESGGMGNDAFCFVIAPGQGGASTNKWTLRNKAGTILVDLGQEGFNVQDGSDVPGFSRNGHVAQRKNDGCVRYRQPSAEKEVLPSAFGSGAGGLYVQVNDVGDLLLQNAQYTSNASSDMLVRKFFDPITGDEVWGKRQFSDDTLPEGWSGLQIDTLANTMPLAEQRTLEALNAYPPNSKDFPLPLMGGVAMKGGKQYPVVLLPVEVKVVSRDDPLKTWTTGPVTSGPVVYTSPTISEVSNGDLISWGVPGLVNGSFEWWATGPNSSRKDGPTGAGKNEWKLENPLDWIPGKWRIHCRYTPTGGTVSEFDFEQKIGYRSPDITVLGWIDGTQITLPSGVDHPLVPTWPSGTSPSPVSVGFHMGNAATRGLFLLEVGGGSSYTIPLAPTAARRYVNAHLIKNSSNTSPPPLFQTSWPGSSELKIVDDQALNAFLADKRLYRSFHRFQAKFELDDLGKIQGSPKILEQDSAVGKTPVDIGVGTIQFEAENGVHEGYLNDRGEPIKFNPKNGKIHSAKLPDDFERYTQGRVSTAMMHGGPIGKNLNNLEIPWIWSIPEFSAAHAIAGTIAVPEHEIFPVYHIYFNGKRFETLNSSISEAIIEQFIQLGETP